MRTVDLIGIGAGDPEDLTVKAIATLNRADVVYLSVKDDEGDELLRFRRELCERFVERSDQRIVEIADPTRDAGPDGHRYSVRQWYDKRAASWGAALREHLGDDEVGAFLVWGDPSLYDGTLRVLELVRDRDDLALTVRVVPGITAVQSLTARHGITLNRVGGSVLITTGRELAAGRSAGIDDVAVMLDPHCSFLDTEDGSTSIWWGAYLGTPDEILIAGTVAGCGEEIRGARAEAKERHGWVFDTYLLRRPRS